MPDKWVIITQDKCPSCTDAKTLMLNAGIHYSEFSATYSPLLKNLLRDMGVSTVPQVFHNGERIGGFEQLRAYLAD